MGLLSNLAVLLAAASAVSAADPAPADAPKITSITFSGSGCPNNAKFSGSFSDPVITFPNFVASLPGNQTVACQAHLQASGASPGWQAAISRNTVKGRVSLSPGTALTYYTTVYFSQDAANTETLSGFISNTGDSTINQAVTLVAKADDKVWSPCTGDSGYTGILNVNFRGALAGEGKAYFEANTEEWDLVWRRC